MELERAVELICEVLSASATFTEDEVKFESTRNSIAPQSVLRSEIGDALSELPCDESSSQSRLLTDTSGEFLVAFSGPVRSPRWRDDLELKDDIDGYHYRLGKPSLPFALSIADKLSKLSQESGRLNRSQLFLHRNVFADREVGILERFIDAQRITSLRIVADEKTASAIFQSLADSFYFHVGYNLDYPVVPQPLQEHLRRTRIQNLRRANRADLDAPHRRYIPELVHNYQLALSSDSPMLSFLSYYHVAEHWFEEVFQNEIALKVRGVITAPGFSYKRMKDLRNLIKTVSSELKSRDDEVVINELSALKLTLKKYVDITALAESIDSFDASLLNHYATNRVAFSDGDEVDLRSVADDLLFARLARRIYKNRNALVHRKDGAKTKFRPFRDDRSLEPEVPLMRFIAEQIIIASATV